MQCSSRLAMQIMSVGGNGRARQFFKQHGWSELGADKIEQKVSMQHKDKSCLPVSFRVCTAAHRGARSW